ncbi:MAG TPA: SH3 domain-containing protein [Chloroflexi bacterium]|nr:MAG: hypothetical protein DRI46_02310 [Chloroflexota bacterium]HDD55207.1 SH3 domain-containing protein [Chloroflexota bacterium]
MKKFLNPWVMGGSILTASLLLVMVYLISGGVLPGGVAPYQGGAEIMVIPVPTATQTPQPSITPVILASPTPPMEDGYLQGAYVQVSGTEGEGLRLRIEPSLNGRIAYLGLEGEIFLITGGPVERDGYLWWQIEAPLNTSRKGWVVSNYLQPAQGP